jgi:hypothetical protein
MNIEVNEEAATGATVSIIFIGMFACIAFGCHKSEQGSTERKKLEVEQQTRMLQEGYTQQLEPNSFTPVWKKEKKP